MSSPMIELPEHLPLSINAEGQGPVPEDEAVAVICWSCAEVWPCQAVAD